MNKKKALGLLVAGLLLGSTRAPTRAPTPTQKKKADREADRRARVLAALPWVRPACQRWGVPVAIVLAVLDVESHGYPGATSPAGARGYMQLMPATAAIYQHPPTNPYDPESNIEGGVHLLADLWAKYGDWWAVFTAYNAGPKRLQKNPKNYRMIYVSEVLARYPIYALVK